MPASTEDICTPSFINDTIYLKPFSFIEYSFQHSNKAHIGIGDGSASIMEQISVREYP